MDCTRNLDVCHDQIVEGLYLLKIKSLCARIAAQGITMLDDALAEVAHELRHRGHDWEINRDFGFYGAVKAAQALPALTHTNRDLVEAVFTPRRSQLVIDVLERFIATNRIGQRRAVGR